MVLVLSYGAVGIGHLVVVGHVIVHVPLALAVQIEGSHQAEEAGGRGKRAHRERRSAQPKQSLPEKRPGVQGPGTRCQIPFSGLSCLLPPWLLFIV